MRAALISLEDWDDVWRRNQYLADALVRQKVLDTLLFVEPARLGRPLVELREVAPGITAVRPGLALPRRAAGLAVTAGVLRRRLLASCDLLWVNDPRLGALCLAPGQPAVYDVTDVTPIPLPGNAPHVGYIGTLHEHRLDLDLVAGLAADSRVGAVHLVGPNCLSPGNRRRIDLPGRVFLHGAVAHRSVPAWTTAMDLLVSPHLVTEFTLSLDAIKSYEYVASGRPVVATPTSNFQHLDGVTLARPEQFVEIAAVRAAASRTSPAVAPGSATGVACWDERARQFALAITGDLHLAGGAAADTARSA